MNNPSSYKGEVVECYYDIETVTYRYQYKVTYSFEVLQGWRSSNTRYYGYCEGNGKIESYGADASYFITASKRGQKTSILA